MIVLASVSAAVVVALLGVLTAAAVRRLGDNDQGSARILALLEHDDGHELGAIRDRLEKVERDVEKLPAAWDAAKREARAAEGRARYHAGRALQELEEHGLSTPGMDQVAGELFETDGEAGGAEPVPAVPEGQAPGPDPDDWLAITRAKKYNGS